MPEGLPTGMLKEFGDSMRDALLIRQSFVDLRDNFRRVVDPTLQSNTKGVFFVFLVLHMFKDPFSVLLSIMNYN